MEGRVVVGVDDSSARSLDVFLNYVERSPDFEEVGIRMGGGQLHTGDLRKGHSYRFQPQLPEGALPAYHSKHGSLWWEVEVRLDRKLRSDSGASVPIDVLPGSA